MGIYDREYTRREGPSFLGSWADNGKVCKWLIGLTLVAFVANLITTDTKQSLYGPLTLFLGLNSNAVLHGQIWRLLTYVFIHDPQANIWPFVFNLLMLWWFGRDLEEVYGSREYLAFYLASAVIGGMAYFLATVAHLPSLEPFYLGCSSAVAAVMVLCAIHFPTRTILLFFVLPVPIWLLAVIMVGYDALLFLQGGTAHIAGTLSAAGFAFAYGKLQWRLSGLLPGSWRPSVGWQRLTRPRLRVYREEDAAPVSVSAGPPSDEEQLEAKIDAILEKISRVGKENLTENEQQLLMRASEVFRRRRS